MNHTFIVTETASGVEGKKKVTFTKLSSELIPKLPLVAPYSSVIPYDKSLLKWKEITGAAAYYITKDMMLIYSGEGRVC